MTKSKLTMAAVSSVVALGLVATSGQAIAGKKGMEKCQGVAAKSMNDCGTSKHACAGQATVDNDPEEWVYVPTGTCGKIAGGNVKG